MEKCELFCEISEGVQDLLPFWQVILEKYLHSPQSGLFWKNWTCWQMDLSSLWVIILMAEWKQENAQHYAWCNITPETHLPAFWY